MQTRQQEEAFSQNRRQTWELGAEVGQGGIKDAMSSKWQSCSVTEKTEM